MDDLLVNPKYQQAWSNGPWQSVAAAVEHFLPDYQERRKVTVQPVRLPSNGGAFDAFFKLYHHRPGGWRFWMRTSKARREYENYAVFEKLGVPAAEAIACGEERDRFGRLRRAFIVTRAVPNALTLDDFFQSRPPRNERHKILAALAEIVRRLHAAQFYYYDLVGRNILVSSPAAGEKQVVLIDCPRGGTSRVASGRKRLRDLASIDKAAAQFCSRPERLRFLLAYSGRDRIDDEVRALARSCVEYRRTRWPNDWRGK